MRSDERIELHCHTKMSKMEGVADIAELIDTAYGRGMSAIAITDIDSVQAFPEAHNVMECRKSFVMEGDGQNNEAFKIIYGAEIRLVEDAKSQSLDDIIEGKSYRIVILVQNEQGLKNLYRIISLSQSEYYESCPKISKSEILRYRDGLLIGSCGNGGEITDAIFKERPKEELERLVAFYDYLEIEPVENLLYAYGDRVDIRRIIQSIISLGESCKRPVIASADVYYVDSDDEIYHRILKHATGCDYDKELGVVKHYLLSTENMLEEFSYLGDEVARKVVIDNTHLIANKIEHILPISQDRCFPIYPDADDKLKSICFEKAHEIYGEKLPLIVEERLNKELCGIIKNGFASTYMIVRELVKKGVEDGCQIGTRGSAGSSLVAYLAGITEINPLQPHYICPKCQFSDFDVLNTEGFHVGDVAADLPDKDCPACGSRLNREGFNIPVETFLGYSLNKLPDFDFNFPDEYQETACEYIGTIDGIKAVYRSGTVGTLVEHRVAAYAYNYCMDKYGEAKPELIEKAVKRLEGVKKVHGVHPGSVIMLPENADIVSFTPIIQKREFGVLPRTHFDYHTLDYNLQKLDILRHTDMTVLKKLKEITGVDPTAIPLNDDKVMSLFTGTEALGVKPEEIGGVKVGTLGVSEFGGFPTIRQMLEKASPRRFSDVIRFIGFMHGTDVWIDNADNLIRDGIAAPSDCIAYRDDIFLYLESHGMDSWETYQIAEYVRKGKGAGELKESWVEDMRENGIPEWYIDSCAKISYLFPKAHGVNYALTSWRLLYYKLYFPNEFYKTWLEYKANAVDVAFVEKGYDYVRNVFDNMEKEDACDGYQWDLIKEIPVVLEMYARNVDTEYVTSKQKI